MIGMSSNVLSVRKPASMSGRWDAFITEVFNNRFVLRTQAEQETDRRGQDVERC